MRTAIRLATLALLLSTTIASAQPAPARLTPAEEAALRAELKRLEIEHVGRYFLGATAYEDVQRQRPADDHEAERRGRECRTSPAS